MKRISVIILLLLAYLSASAAVGDSVRVDNAKDFIAALKANRKYINLTADINLKDLGSSVDKFTGEIDGSTWAEDSSAIVSHTISGLKQSMTVSMEGANIHDINFSDSKPSWNWNSINEGMGVICRHSSGCQFWNITLDNIEVSYNGFWKGIFLNPIRHYNGGIVVGKDHGSTFQNISITNSMLYVSSTEGGGVVGDSYNSTFCDIDIDGTCAIHVEGSDNLADGNSGGVAGRAQNCTFKNCTNNGVVSGVLDNVGGIAGKASKNCKFEYCVNNGYVTHLDISSPKDLANVTLAYGTGCVSAAVLPKAKLGIQIYRNRSLFAKYQKALNQYNKDYYHYKKLTREYKGWQNQMTRRQDEINRLNRIYGKQPDATKSGTINVGKMEAKNTCARLKDEIKDLRAMDKVEPVEPVKPAEVAEEVRNVPSFSTLEVVLTVLEVAAVVAQITYEAQDNDDVGGIVGRMTGGGSLIACQNNGFVRCDDAFSGGIAGETIGDALIDCCLNAGSVQGYEQTGGIVGKIANGTIRGCLNTGNISRGNSSASSFGRIYGEKGGSVKAFANCYSSNTTDSESSKERKVSQKMLASGGVALYLNEQTGNGYWRQTINEDYFPVLDSMRNEVTASTIDNNVDTVYHISTAAGLVDALSNQYSNAYLKNDIDVGGNIFNLSSEYMPFHGCLDGQGHTISNIEHTLNSNKLVSPFNNDNRESYSAILPFAQDATFKNFSIENCVLNIGGGEAKYVALLVADSKNCTYDNVHITGQSKVDNWSKGAADHVAGLISRSQGDSLVNCSVGSGCKFYNISGLLGTFYTRPVGGIAAMSKNSKFINCFNAATLYGKDTDYAGGIVAHDEGGSTLIGCLNTGSVKAQDFVGGLVGRGTTTTLTNCVNTGSITGLDKNTSIGGVAGKLESGSKMSTSYGFGDVTKTNSNYNGGLLIGNNDGTEVSESQYYGKSNGTQITSLQDSDIPNLTTGKFAYDLNSASENTVWYQALDKNYSFPTKYFVPISTAGTIYANYLCDENESLSYSNYYHAAKDHVSNPSSIGICRECGYLVQAPEEGAVMNITSADDLIDFSNLVRNKTYSGLSARLTCDIDLKGYDYTPIGSNDVPYTGTFSGGFHRIKNMEITANDNDACGFIQCLGGDARVDSLVIDSTCTIKGAGYGVAGIAGCVRASDGGFCTVTISHCGNEATIIGNQNVAGILGTVFEKNTFLIITDCYNTGSICGKTESAAICGYEAERYQIENCYNIGQVEGVDESNYFYRTPKTGSTHDVFNCYDINGAQGTGVSKLTSEQLASGELCFKINGSDNMLAASKGFYQRIDTLDTYPNFEIDELNIVESYDKKYCDGSTTLAYYNPYRSHPDYTQTFHNFDENGFCTTISGEVHYETPDTVHHDKTIVYQLKNMGNLYWLADQVNNGWDSPNCELLNDIVLNEDVANNYAHGGIDTMRKWTPIGVEGHTYHNAYFDGKGHTISGLVYVGEQNGVGLFGMATNGAVISNLGVTDCYLAGGNGVGAIIGWGGQSYTDKSTWGDTNGPAIHNCYSNGTVRGTDYVGGLAGFINDGVEAKERLSFIYSSANVWETTHSGKLFGYIGTSDVDKIYADTLYNCYYIRDDNAEDYPCHVGTPMSNFNFNIGKVCQLLNDAEPYDSVVWRQDISTQKVPVFGDEGVILSRTEKQPWGTLVLPYTVYSDSTITYFTIHRLEEADENGTAKLIVKQVDNVEANTPCIYRLNNGVTELTFDSELREIITTGNDVVSTSYTINDGEKELTMTGDYFGTVDITANFVLNDSTSLNKIEASKDGSFQHMEPYHAFINGTGLDNIKKLNIVVIGSDGDINDDGYCNELDAEYLADVLSGVQESPNLFDLNLDGRFSPGDQATLITKLSGLQSGSANDSIFASKDSISTTLIGPYGDNEWAMQVGLQVDSNYVSFMMDIALPEGVTVTSVEPVDLTLPEFAISHCLADTANNIYRIVAYNMDNQSIKKYNEIPILKVALQAPSDMKSSEMTPTFKDAIFSKSGDLTDYDLKSSGQTTDLLDKYFKITPVDYGDMTTTHTGNVTARLAYFKGSNGEWKEFTYWSTLTLMPDEAIWFRANGSHGKNATLNGEGDNYIAFQTEDSIAASGNIMSLLDASCSQTVPPSYAFRNLFKDCTGLYSIPDLKNVKLENGVDHVFEDMCSGCTNLRVNAVEQTVECPGTKWNMPNYGTDPADNLTGMFAGTGGNFTGSPANGVSYYIADKPYTRSMANKWGTIVLPFDIELSDNYDLYEIASVSSDAITLKKITENLPANTPALIRMSECSKSKTTGNYELSLPIGDIGSTDIRNLDAINGLTLRGTYAKCYLTSGYILANNSFWNISSLSKDVYCQPFHAYMKGTLLEGNPARLGIGIDDNETSVETLPSDETLGEFSVLNSEGSAIYDVNGRRLNDLQQGVNIVKFRDGTAKKIIVK